MQAMTPSDQDIRRVAEAIVRRFRPGKVILFGSRVYGEPRPDSDVDLLVVLPFEGSPVAVMSAMLAEAYRAMERPFAIEVHPRRPHARGTAERDVADPIMREALERGVVLYEAAA